MIFIISVKQMLLKKLQLKSKAELEIFLAEWQYPKRHNISKQNLYELILTVPPPPKPKSKVVLQNFCKENGMSVKASVSESLASIKQVGNAKVTIEIRL